MTADKIRVRKTQTTVEEGTEAFGFLDQKGRFVGYRWAISTVTATPIPEGEKVGSCWLWPADALLTRFEVWGHPTRNGKLYGALSDTPHFDTLEEARAKVAERIRNARKRDAKKFNAA